MTPGRKRLGDALLGVAIIGGIATVVLAILPLIAGTFTVGNHLALRSLAFASFDGIVPSNDSTTFLVRMYWFPSAFAWEYPQAPEGTPKVGFSNKGLIWELDPVQEFRTIAKDLNLPRDEWYCPSTSTGATQCENPFFEAWRSWMADPFGGAPLLYFFIMILAILLTTSHLAQEWAIKKKPYWMRCRCIIGKRFCPCPTGTREEVESAGEHVWDKVRLAYWGLVFAYFLLPAIHGTILTSFFIMYVGHFERRLPAGLSMNVKRGTSMDALAWGTAAAAAVSFVAVLIKWYLTRRPKGWVEQQGLGDLPEPAGDHPAPFGPGSRKYTDRDGLLPSS